MELNVRSFLVIFLVVLGIAFQMVRMWPAQIQPNPHAEDAAQLYTPYAVSDDARTRDVVIRDMPPSRVQIVQGNATLPAVEAADVHAQLSAAQSELDKAKTKEKSKKVYKNWHWVWNKKTKKWVWKRKKKKEAKETAIAAIEAPPQYKIEKPKANSDLPTPAGPSIQSTTTQVVGTGASKNAAALKFLSFEEWKKKLLDKADAKETTEFATQFKKHMVTDETFYKIVDLMLKDNRTEMQGQGILALGLTPSVKSFQGLAKQHASSQTSSPHHQTITQYLALYGKLKNLDVLQDVMSKTQDPAMLRLAQQQLSASIQANLQTGTPSKSTIAQYTGFTAILTRLGSNADQTVASTAQELLRTLNSVTTIVAQTN